MHSSIFWTKHTRPSWAILNALPFATESMDLVILPFVLSQHPNAHAVLREAQRVVCGYERQLLVLDLNPYSLWRVQAKRLQAATGCQHEQTMTPRRLADWLQLARYAARPEPLHQLPAFVPTPPTSAKMAMAGGGRQSLVATSGGDVAYQCCWR